MTGAPVSTSRRPQAGPGPSYGRHGRAACPADACIPVVIHTRQRCTRSSDSRAGGSHRATDCQRATGGVRSLSAPSVRGVPARLRLTVVRRPGASSTRRPPVRGGGTVTFPPAGRSRAGCAARGPARRLTGWSRRNVGNWPVTTRAKRAQGAQQTPNLEI